MPPLASWPQGQKEGMEVQASEQGIFPVHVKLQALHDPGELHE